MKQNKTMLPFCFLILNFSVGFTQISDSLKFRITLKNHEIHYLKNIKPQSLDSLFNSISPPILSDERLGMIDSAESIVSGQWKTIFKPDSGMKRKTSVYESDPQRFNYGQFFLQVAGGYLLSGGLAILSGSIVHAATKDDKGIGSVIAGFLTFNLTSPFTVYFIGEKLNKNRKVESDITNTFLYSIVLSGISYGSLSPVGAAFGYQASKHKIYDAGNVETEIGNE